MDNLTHSLTGALAAKLLETKTEQQPDAKQQRAMFWLFVLCANLPDIDVLLGLYGDPIFSTRHHRGITHSVLFAPIMALAPTVMTYCWSAHRTHPPLRGAGGCLAFIATAFRNLFTPKAHPPNPLQGGNFREHKFFVRFYLCALLGILIHIAFDVITSYGTRLLLPFSETRFALDWMFIIDPFFTLPFALLLACARRWRRWSRQLVLSAAVFVLGYLGLEAMCSRLAHERTQQALRAHSIAPIKISVLPQPLSVFKWKALAQTETAVYQAFFSLWEKSPPVFEKFDNASDAFVAAAIATPEVQWYLTFARHPWIRSIKMGEQHVVELTDLQFSVDQTLINALGASERQLPFVMRFEFSPQGELLRRDFNGTSFTTRRPSEKF